jgi:hypothetical protein
LIVDLLDFLGGAWMLEDLLFVPIEILADVLLVLATGLGTKEFLAPDTLPFREGAHPDSDLFGSLGTEAWLLPELVLT